MKREFPSTPDEAFEAAIGGAYYAEPLTDGKMDGRLTRCRSTQAASAERLGPRPQRRLHHRSSR